jgi:hypothetical protein
MSVAMGDQFSFPAKELFTRILQGQDSMQLWHSYTFGAGFTEHIKLNQGQVGKEILQLLLYMAYKVQTG